MRGLILLLFSLATLFAQPKIKFVRNAAALTPPGAPFYGIAQGSVFSVDGEGLGPDDPVTLTPAADAPLGIELEGVSIKVTVKDAVIDAFIYSVSATRVTALLPSTATIGDGTLVLTYKGSASGSVFTKVVSGAMGLSVVGASGIGGAAPLFAADPGAPAVSFLNSANPGEALIFDGTGLGATTADETVPNDSPSDMPDTPFEFYFGSIKAQVNYHGRSTRPGWDRVEVVVPEGIAGCYTSAYAKTGDFVSNTVTVPIVASGRICEEFGFRPPDFVGSFEKETIDTGWYNLGKFITNLPAIGPSPAFTSVSDSANAQFLRYNTFQYSSYGGRGDPGYGSCVMTTALGEPGILEVPILKHLDAGPAIMLTLPNGNTIRMSRTSSLSDYVYSSAPPTRPGFIPNEGGTFKYNAPGGEDVGEHEVTLKALNPLRWSNRATITAVNRSKELEVQWTGGDEDTYVIIYGASGNGANPPLTTLFNCAERTSAGRFTIPKDILAAMIPSGVFLGQLAVINYKFPVKFTAPGIDNGNYSYYIWDETLVYFQ